MCLDYLSNSLWATFKDIEELERQNREDGRRDYQEHIPDNEFGEQKKKLMDKMVVDTNTYRTPANVDCLIYATCVLSQKRQTASGVWLYIQLTREMAVSS